MSDPYSKYRQQNTIWAKDKPKKKPRTVWSKWWVPLLAIVLMRGCWAVQREYARYGEQKALDEQAHQATHVTDESLDRAVQQMFEFEAQRLRDNQNRD